MTILWVETDARERKKGCLVKEWSLSKQDTIKDKTLAGEYYQRHCKKASKSKQAKAGKQVHHLVSCICIVTEKQKYPNVRLERQVGPPNVTLTVGGTEQPLVSCPFRDQN